LEIRSPPPRSRKFIRLKFQPGTKHARSQSRSSGQACAGCFYRTISKAIFVAARLQEKYLPASAPPAARAGHRRRWRKPQSIEMDLRLEAAALSELGENTANDPGFRVPAVDWERTGRDVLTIEWIDGIKMNQVEALRDCRPRP
jgi:hypothetical protein